MRNNNLPKYITILVQTRLLCRYLIAKAITRNEVSPDTGGCLLVEQKTRRVLDNNDKRAKY